MIGQLLHLILIISLFGTACGKMNRFIFSSTFAQVKRVQQENEDLFSVQERNRKLQEELTESETKCADFETKVGLTAMEYNSSPQMQRLGQ